MTEPHFPKEPQAAEHPAVGSSEWFETGIETVITHKMLTNMKVEAYNDPELRAVSMQLRASIFRFLTGFHEGDSIEVPASLWDHIKMKLPWLKGRYRRVPVMFHAYNLCPHINEPDEQVHLNWARPEYEEWR